MASALSGGTHRLLLGRPGIVTMLLVFLVLVANSPLVLSLDIRWCRQPLGLQSGAIPDSALSASSAFDGPSVGPQHARLHVEKSGGAWCPKQQIAENVNEYLQIDLAAAGGNQSDSVGASVVISGIATQGRWGNGRGQEYAEQFRIHYWRPELAIWRLYRSWNGDEILEGNSDTKTAVHHDLNPPIIATRVRIIPHGIYPRTVCMRVELYGCRQNGYIVSYSIPVGDTWSGTLILDDLTYDGFKEPNEAGISRWRGGLGMLTDGHYGLDNFKMDLGARKGHGWVGWKKDSFVSRTAAAAPRPSPLQLLFKFSSPRNLSAVHIHTNNYFSKNVQVFSKASLSFSLGGSTFGGNFNYYYMEDTVLESARNVSIRIPNNVVTTYVKIQLWFSSHWIMISEVTFDSEMVEGHPGNEFEDQEEDQDEIQQTTTALPADPSTSSGITPTGVFNTAESAGSHGYFEAVVGALSAVMLLLIVAIVVIILMNHRKKCVQETIVTFSAPFDVQSGGVVKVAPSSLDVDEVIGYDKPMPVNNLQYISQHSIITGDLNKSTDPDDSGYATASVIGLQHNQFSSLRTHHLPAVRYHSSGVSLLGSNQAVGGHFPRVSTDPISRRSCGKSVQLKSASNIGFVWNIRPLADSFVLESASKTLQVPEIPRQSLRLVEWLGSTAHGEAYVCHVMNENNSDYENMSMKQPVVVRGGPIKEPKNFQAEIKMLASLQHPNICSLLAYSNSSGTGWMIFECPVYGDLNTYLKQQSTEMSNANLLKMVCQIARAMEYLEGKGLVHKDLASRNCLLGPELHVKVSDLAVVTTAFKEDYGEVRGRKPLPLRWLPWETLVLGKFTEYSGVWMLAVTVWELATGARERPFHTMNDTQVILNADHFYYSDGREVVLSQPKGRPCQLYKWMMSCWSREESLRPTFHESATFLDQLAECF